MPYVAPERRPQYDRYEQMPPENGGDLNYVICRLVARYTEYHGLKYDVIASVRDALGGALNEYNVRVADPYERKKESENGTVWGSLI